MNASDSSYGKIAVLSAKSASSTPDPKAAWEESAATVLAHSPTGTSKRCPKGAFLGLAYAGEVVGFDRDDGKAPGANGAYALVATSILRSTPALAWSPITLWKAVMELEGKSKNHNSQMHVVLALWQSGLLVGRGDQHLRSIISVATIKNAS